MTKQDKIWIYGASGHGSVILDCLLAQGYVNIGIVDDDNTKKTLRLFSIETPAHINYDTDRVVYGIGDNQTRKQLSLKPTQYNPAVIHPTATVSQFANIGKGTVVFHHSVIQSGCEIGEQVIINTKASIDHDCKVGNYAHISPGAILCGNVSIGDLTWVGAGAVIIQGVKVGSNVMIGAGSVVIRDVPDNAVVVGNPGKIIKYQKEF